MVSLVQFGTLPVATVQSNIEQTHVDKDRSDDTEQAKYNPHLNDSNSIIPPMHERLLKHHLGTNSSLVDTDLLVLPDVAALAEEYYDRSDNVSFTIEKILQRYSTDTPGA